MVDLEPWQNHYLLAVLKVPENHRVLEVEQVERLRGEEFVRVVQWVM